MKSLKEALSEFENYLRNKPGIFQYLKDGLSHEYIVSQLSEIGVSSEELNTLFTWKNGIKYDDEWTAGQLDFFSFGVLISLEDVIKQYKLSAESSHQWGHLLIPLFTTGSGDYVLFNANRDDKGFKKLYLYAPSLTFSDSPITIYSSLETLFETINQCYKTKAYKFDKSGELEIDYDLEDEISAELNPDASYWNN